MDKLFLVVLTVLVLLERGASDQELFVTAYPNGDPCPDDDEIIICKPFSFYLNRTNEYFIDNTTFYFMSGTHYLPEDIVLFSEINDLIIHGLGDIVYDESNEAIQSISVLECPTGIGGILFNSCDNIIISQITMTSCSALISWPEGSANSSLSVYNSGIITIDGLSIQNGSYNGLLLINSTDVYIESSSFVYNARDNDSRNLAIFYYHDAENIFDRYVHIYSTNITHGYGGLFLMLLQRSFYVHTYIESSKLSHNVKNLLLYSNGSCYFVFHVENIVCSHSSEVGFRIDHVSTCPIRSYVRLIKINNSNFISNSYTALLVYWLSNDYGYISISSTNFTDNIGAFPSTIGIEQISRSGIQSNVSDLEVDIVNLRCERNIVGAALAQKLGILDKVKLSIVIHNIYNMTITNSTFIDNIGSAFSLYNSLVVFDGQHSFINNSGIYGGGLTMANNAYIYLTQETQMIFIGNSAIQGGAIYVSQFLPQVYDEGGTDGLLASCFYQMVDPIFESPKGLREIFIFENNTALVAGPNVYSVLTDNCYSFAAAKNVEDDFFVNISKFDNQFSADYGLSSDVIAICFCINETKDCSINMIHTTAFPGSIINVSVVAVGNKNGNTHALISIENKVSLLNRIIIHPMCTNLSYTLYVKHDNTSEDITSITALTFSDSISNALAVNVTIQHCPEGYQLSHITKICECLPDIEENAVCYDSEMLVKRSSSTWIGYDDTLNCTIVNSRCPFDYCKFSSVNITIRQPNSQCAFNRVGRLCGACSDNESLVLGSNACKPCHENTNTFIVFFFVLAGILLVFFLFFLNLTVSVGTINGLVFFANVVKIYEPLFTIDSIPFLSTFISWINLDFGIEICFYHKMEACGKHGLQFVFPLYLWSIIFLIILISKYSTKVANIIGSNGIPVLATLLLLSFTKLLRAVIIIFSISYVECNGKFHLFWYIDPNQPYFWSAHLALFIIAILFALLIIPYALFLLLYPLLEISSPRCRQKVSWFLFKTKPFFDAYRGPHTGYFCIWPGIMLVVRLGLAIIVAIVSDPKVSFSLLLLVALLLITVLSFGKVYSEKHYLHSLDTVFLLGLMVIAYLFHHSYGRENIEPIFGIAIVLTIAAVILVVILVYHLYKFSIVGTVFRKQFGARLKRNDSSKMPHNTEIEIMEVADDADKDSELNLSGVYMNLPEFKNNKKIDFTKYEYTN